MSKENPIIFISYAHADNKQKIVEHFLNILEQQKYTNWTFWTDKAIPIGDDWAFVISKALKECDFGIILVSAAFAQSKYINSIELPELLNNKKIFPVYLSPYHLSINKVLSKKQFFQYEFGRLTSFFELLDQFNDKTGGWISNNAKDQLYVEKLVQDIEQNIQGSNDRYYRPNDSGSNTSLNKENSGKHSIKALVSNIVKLIKFVYSAKWSTQISILLSGIVLSILIIASLKKDISDPIIKFVNLTNNYKGAAEFEIVRISADDKRSYYFTFEGYWKHFILGCQNSIGDIVESGSSEGNINILVTVESLIDGSIIFNDYYDGIPIKVTSKYVRVVCSPRDRNSIGRNDDGHIPSKDISSCLGRKNMYVFYSFSR